jgi:hypothetical protein
MLGIGNADLGSETKTAQPLFRELDCFRRKVDPDQVARIVLSPLQVWSAPMPTPISRTSFPEPSSKRANAGMYGSSVYRWRECSSNCSRRD